MSVASSSRVMLRSLVKRSVSHNLAVSARGRATARWSAASVSTPTPMRFAGSTTLGQLATSPMSLSWQLSPQQGGLFRQSAGYATTAYSNAQPLNHSAPGSSSGKVASSSEGQSESDQPDPDEPPPKATIRERMRFLMRRYGWWALAVYLLASTVDFSLVFLAVHMLGADHIRDLETRVRDFFGMGKREMEDHEVAAWPVPTSIDVMDGTSTGKGILEVNNSDTAKLAVKRVQDQQDVEVVKTTDAPLSKVSSKSSGNRSALWAEAVLAYTIHKTLLLPFRVGVTAAITPSFVKYMVRLGWARDNNAVRLAAAKAKAAKEAAQQAAAASKAARK